MAPCSMSELKPFAERSIEVLFIGAYKYTEESPDEVSMQLNAGSIQSLNTIEASRPNFWKANKDS